jgi:GYF domain 2
MKYKIQRGINEYGPYTLADLQRYVAQGNILLTDLARSEGMTEWVPVSQVIGDIPVPVPTPGAGGTVYSGTPAGTAYGGTSAYGTAVAPAMAAGPVPPDFHWALVLLLAIVTCTLFNIAWLIVEAAFIRKIKPQSKGLLLVILAYSCYFLGGFMNGFTAALNHGQANPLSGLFSIAGLVLLIVGVFSMRSDLEDYYNTTENINLRLSGVGSALLTLFFGVYYFQWHFSRIAKWKKTGVLEPQS